MKKIKPWVTNQVLDLCDKRRQLRQQKYTRSEAGLEYRVVNTEVRKMMKAHTMKAGKQTVAAVTIAVLKVE